jgi:hypothetical protein
LKKRERMQNASNQSIKVTPKTLFNKNFHLQVFTSSIKYLRTLKLIQSCSKIV